MRPRACWRSQAPSAINEELAHLNRRAKIITAAATVSASSAILVCLLIGLLFLANELGSGMDRAVELLFALAMVGLIVCLMAYTRKKSTISKPKNGCKKMTDTLQAFEALRESLIARDDPCAGEDELEPLYEELLAFLQAHPEEREVLGRRLVAEVKSSRHAREDRRPRLSGQAIA